MGQSVTRGALALLSTQPLTWGVSLLAAAYFPRLLGAEALGQVTLALTICTLAATATGFGISDFLVRRVAQRPDRLQHDVGLGLVVQSIGAAIGALLIALLGGYVFASMVPYPLLLVSMIPLLAGPAQSVLLSLFRGTEQHKRYAWLNATGAIATTAGTLLVLALGGGVVLAVGVGGAVYVANTIVGWKVSGVRVLLPGLDGGLLGEAAELVRMSLPFLVWQITLLGYGQIDRVLLGAFVPAAELGWYAAAYRIISVVVFAPMLVVVPLFPALSRSVNDTLALRTLIAQTLRLLMVVMAALAAVSVVLVPLVPRLLGWPADFDQAVPLMSILALHLPIVAVDMVFGAVLMAVHKEMSLVYVGIVALVFNVLTNLFLIPYFQQTAGNGAIGASIVTVLTEILMSIGAVTLLPKRLLDPAIAWEAARLVIAGTASVLVGFAIQPALTGALHFMPLAFVLLGMCATLTFGAVAVVLRAITLDDVRSATALVARPGR